MIELSPILEGLIQRTTEGKLKWSRTVPHDRFVTSVDAIAIVIQVTTTVSRYSMKMARLLSPSITGIRPVSRTNSWRVYMCWPAG